MVCDGRARLEDKVDEQGHIITSLKSQLSNVTTLLQQLMPGQIVGQWSSEDAPLSWLVTFKKIFTMFQLIRVRPLNTVIIN